MKLNYDIIFIVLLLAMIIPYFYVALNSQIIFGDEGFFLFNAKWIWEHGAIPAINQLYKTDIFSYRLIYPPMFMLIESGAWGIGGLTLVKLLSPTFTLITAVFLYLLCRKIGNKLAGVISVGLLLATPTTVLHGILAYTDALLVMNITIFAYFMYNYFESYKRNDLILCGLFAGFAIMSKAIGLIVVPMFIIYFLMKSPKKFKGLLIFFLMAALIASPWVIRNYVLFNAFCYEPFLGPKCEYILTTQPDRIAGLAFDSRTGNGGVDTGVISFGFLPFFDFAFGLGLCGLFILGLLFATSKDSKIRTLSIAWLVMFTIFFITNITMFPFSMFRQAELIYPRAEDSGRYILGAVPLLALVAGFFIAGAIEKLKGIKYGKVMAILLVIFVAYMSFGPYYSKLQISQQIKNFPQSWFDACAWVKTNTPTNSTIYAIYAAQVGVNCDRSTMKGFPDDAEIQLTGNDTSYEHLKLHGFDYIYIPVGQISNQALEEAYYYKFYNYIISSSHFKKVFDDTNTYGGNGVQIFQVL